MPNKHVILIVDDVPDNLSLLSDELDEAGYMVLIATDGFSALERLDYVTPHLILLDAVMPGIDGFETCRRIRALARARHVPIIFMTGLTETEHVVKGFEVGGNDYVIKPLQAREVIARIEAQLRSANLISLATTASDAAAHAVIVLDQDGMPIWKTSKAEQWMAAYFPDPDAQGASLPKPLRQWVSQHLDSIADHRVPPLLVQRQGATLHVTFEKGERSGDLLLRFEEHIDALPTMLEMDSYQLTPREHDVLAWLTKGKTNRDIADILGISPRTVNKHLEHIFVKLGVETRSAAATLALGRGRAA